MSASSGPVAAAPADPSRVEAPEWSIFTGWFFDTCDTPSLSDMKAWNSSKYEGVAIYISGRARGCKDENRDPRDGGPRQTTAWMTQVANDGWAIIPIHVGLQSPCSNVNYRPENRMSIDKNIARQQGAADAREAIHAMQSRGLGRGMPIYLDMEAWDTGNTKCTQAVMAFTEAWTMTVHDAGYISGFYSSAEAGINALAAYSRVYSDFVAPDALWIARWSKKHWVASTAEKVLDDANGKPVLWPGQTRLKQFKGEFNETHGGVTLNIDANYADGPVARFGMVAGSWGTQKAIPGSPVESRLTASRGVEPYRFAVHSGTLPRGLTLDPDGRLHGATKDAGRTSVVISVSDSSGLVYSIDARLTIVVAYSDVPESHTFFPTVSWLAKSRITDGYGDGTFQPDNAVSRGQMAAFLYRFANPDKPGPTCSKKPFPDVPVDYQFCGHIAWLAKTGITSGYDDGKYHPERAVSRGQMAAFLYRVYQRETGQARLPQCTKSPATLKDIAPGYQFCTHITWLVDNGITVGYDNGTYRPTNPVTRGAMSAFLKRLDATITRDR